jgi:hypothetical protein
MHPACSDGYPSRSTSRRAALCRGVRPSSIARTYGPHLRIEEQVPCLRRRDHLPERCRRSTASHPEPVEGHTEQVPGRILDLVHRVPPFPELEERVLHELLRVVAVPGDEVESLEQAFVFRP